MAERKPEPQSQRSFRSHQPPELDHPRFRTVKLVERPIAGGLPFWPFNRTRVIEVPVPPGWQRLQGRER